jgi:hypothetical protein
MPTEAIAAILSLHMLVITTKGVIRYYTYETTGSSLGERGQVGLNKPIAPSVCLADIVTAPGSENKANSLDIEPYKK